jgi:YD repeat-containing protein
LVTRIDYPQDANTPASSEVFTYNGFGQVLTHQLKNGAWERFVYDSRGLLTDKYNPKATLPSGGDPHTHYDYYTANDPIGGNDWIDRVKTVTLPANVSGFQASDTYEYDKNAGGTHVPGRGLVTKITHADGTYQSFGYDAYGNKLWEENELRKRTSYTYDEYNRVLTVKDPIGQTTTYTYSASPYLQTTNNPDTVTTPARIVTSNVYDENFRKTSSAVAGQATWFHYDNVGNQDWVLDPRGTAGYTWPNGDSTYTTYFDYDSRNRKWRIREPLGRTTQLFYEDGINLTRINRPDGTNNWKTYDALNRMIWDTVMQTNSITLNTYFSYNPSGTLGWISDPNEHYTSFYYDASDQRIEMIYHDGTSTRWWGYDDAHNLKSRITVNGEVQNFAYDIRNRKTEMSWIPAGDWASFTYYDDGRLHVAQNPNSTVTRQYDDAGRLTLDQQNITGFGIKSVNYPTYDDDGKLTRMNVGGVSDYDYTFSYDATGRFEKIFITNSSQLFQYHYDPASNETERDNTYINGIRQVYPRDALNRMQYVDVMNGNATLGHEGYSYNGPDGAMDRLTSVDYGNGHSDSFGYYLDGELNQAQLGNLNRTVTYNVDKAGNRQTVVDNNTTTTYTPNTLNQYSAVSGNYIANGAEHEIQSYNKATYQYINDEHLKQVSDTGGNNYYLYYDALGRCVKAA